MLPIWFALTALWAPSGRAQPMVTVKGNTLCPTPLEVTTLVAALLPSVGGAGEPDMAHLEEDGPRLRVTLRRSDGAELGRRWLARAFPCADLAAAVSAVIASWESDIHPEFKLEVAGDHPPRVIAPGPGRLAETVAPLPRSPRPSKPPLLAIPSPPGMPAPLSMPPPLAIPPLSLLPPRAGGAVSPVVVSVPAGATEASARPASSSSPPVAVAVAASAPARFDGVGIGPGASIEVGAAVLGALAPLGPTDAAGGAIGGLVTMGWTPAGHGDRSSIGGAGEAINTGWGGHAGLSAMTERTTPLVSGSAHWRRFALALGAHRRSRIGSRGWLLDVHAEGVGAWLTIRGTGFASNGSDGSLDPGFRAGTRITVGRGRLRAWADLALVGWLFPHVVYERPLDASAALPRFEGTLALGVSLWLGP
jgi:hypothetical protein